MTQQLTDFRVKMAILELLSQKSPRNKFNMIGCPPLDGDLERKLGRRFNGQERALAGTCVEQLKLAGLIRPTYTDFVHPEDWLEITEAGRQALNRCALDDLDVALREIDPSLNELRHGASSALVSGQPDSIRQAAHSARELIRQVLDLLAPADEIKASPQFQASKDATSGVTRKMRIRYVIKKRHPNISDSDTEIIEILCQLIDQLYGKLSAEAHRDAREERKDVDDIVLTTETALRRLLL